MPVTHTAQRVLALLALRGGRETRLRVAVELWPDREPRRALANLRGAVWRLPPAVLAQLSCTDRDLGLDESWWIDIKTVDVAAQPRQMGSRPDSIPLELLRTDLLPDWDEPWLVVERERHRQLRIHLLEEVSRWWCAHGRPDLGAEAALVATEAEPLRESAQILLVSALVQQGNQAAAALRAREFAQRLFEELGILPGPQLRRLMEIDQSSGPTGGSGDPL